MSSIDQAENQHSGTAAAPEGRSSSAGFGVATGNRRRSVRGNGRGRRTPIRTTAAALKAATSRRALRTTSPFR